MQWYLKVLREYATFTGRARRTEYWMFFLINFVIGLVLGVLDAIIGWRSGTFGVGVLGGLYNLAVLVPSLAVGARRLHDTDRSGWWQLIGIIPIIGWIVLIVFFATEGQMSPNHHGPNPKMMAGGDPQMA